MSLTNVTPTVVIAAKTEREQEEDRQFWEAFDELQQFFINKTNCTVSTTW